MQVCSDVQDCSAWEQLLYDTTQSLFMHVLTKMVSHPLAEKLTSQGSVTNVCYGQLEDLQ